MRTVHIQVTGTVQGVFYRATAHEVAEQLGLAGWVRNRADGSVEALAQGTDEQVEAFITWCHQGPRRAVVTGVQVEEVPAKEAMRGFEVKKGS
ncbi:acylphosphatase [Flaviaesturariibacter amylovorans]|uniref:acylphosphatase n=1 Tax=Flaviaesturariibacter amylovorans TaxID=1084520 RepID=A0ABP8GGI8_9BACT